MGAVPANSPPVANAGGPYAGTQGSSVTFDGSRSADPDDDPLTFEWGFGDGIMTMGVTASHVFSSSGIFDVSLTVTDPDGLRDTDTTTATISAEGRMTGGGSFFSLGIRYTHGFELHCDTSQGPNNLEINWGKGNDFHHTELTLVTCISTVVGVEGKPVAGFDTCEGSGLGHMNGEPGMVITFEFTDRGEPGKNTDEVELSITGGPSASKTTLNRGNHQAHPKR